MTAGPPTRCVARSRNCSAIDTARYFPLIPPAKAHTRCNTRIASGEHFSARGFRFFVPNRRGFKVVLSWRRALSRD